MYVTKVEPTACRVLGVKPFLGSVFSEEITERSQRLGMLRQHAQILHGGRWATTGKTEAKFHSAFLWMIATALACAYGDRQARRLVQTRRWTL